MPEATYAELIRGARERADHDSSQPPSLAGYMSYRPKSDIYLLCDALEGRVQEVERLRAILEDIAMLADSPLHYPPQEPLERDMLIIIMQRARAALEESRKGVAS